MVRAIVLAATCAMALLLAACSDDDAGGSSETPGAGGQSVAGAYVFDLNNGQLERVSDEPAFELAWTSDGAKLWYATSFLPMDDDDDAGHVRELNVASREARDVAALEGGGFATFAPDQGLVAFIRRDGTSYTPTVRTADGGFLTYDDGLGAQLRPDGAFLLFESPPCAETQSLHIVELSSGEEFVSDPGAFAATWLPDGRISMSLQSASDAGLPARQVIIDPATRAMVDAADVIGADPAGAYYLSPDGQHALYGGNVNRILLKKTGEGAENEIGSGRVSLADWAPDSSLLAYAALGTLYITEPNGTQRYAVDLAQITEDGGASPVAIRWSPDGTKLAIGVGVLGSGGVCEG